MMLRAGVVAVAALVTGCTGGTDSTPNPEAAARVSRGADGDCVRAWNATNNAVNRSAAAADHPGWSVSVRTFVVSHPVTGPAGDDLVGEGCSFFFRSSTRWRSYSGSWEADGDLRWGTPPVLGGRRTPEQRPQPPNAILRERGTLARLASDPGRPISGREWRAVIDDWYDDGEVDRIHRCVAVRAAIARVPRSGPAYSSVFDDLSGYEAVVC